MMCSNSYLNHYIKVGQLPKCVISSIEMAGQPLVKRAVSSAEICKVFLFTADQERAHAKRFYDLLKNLNGETIDIEGSYPVDYDDSITGLLRAAQHNEMEEADDVYMAFGEKAKEEGFIEAASAFFHIARIEAVHGKRFGLLAELLESGRYYETGRTGYWMCLNCGYIHKGTRVPEVCPTCLEEKGYFIPADLAPYLRGDLIVVY
ncbi:MAG: ferritin family protein [Lachnospiraceae bacterium]|nr:ferritin family protein [Lachnospiraceae bacterium]